MLGLVPWVWEKDVHAVQAVQRQHVVNDLHGVMRADADVAQVLLANAFEQRAHTGLVHLAAQKARLGQNAGNVRRGLAHTEANFQHHRVRGAWCLIGQWGKHCVQVQQMVLVRQQKLRAQGLDGFILARRHATGAFDKAFDAT